MPNSSSCSILYIEKDCNLSHFVSSTLKTYGHLVADFSNCDQALEVLQTNPNLFDLAIMDYQVDGPILAKTIQERPKKLPIILCAPDEFFMFGFPKQPDAFLQKPYNLPELYKVMTPFLDNH